VRYDKGSFAVSVNEGAHLGTSQQLLRRVPARQRFFFTRVGPTAYQHINSVVVVQSSVHDRFRPTPTWVHTTAVIVFVVSVGSLLIMALQTADGAVTDLAWGTDDGLTPTTFDAWVKGVTTELLRASTNPINNVHRLIAAPLGEAPSPEDKALAVRLYMLLELFCTGGKMRLIILSRRVNQRGDLAWADIMQHYQARVAGARMTHAKRFRDQPKAGGMSLEQWFNTMADVRDTLRRAGEDCTTFDFNICWTAFCAVFEEKLLPPEISELCAHNVQLKLHEIQDKCQATTESARAEGVAAKKALTLIQVFDWITEFMLRHPHAPISYVKNVHGGAAGAEKVDTPGVKDDGGGDAGKSRRSQQWHDGDEKPLCAAWIRNDCNKTRRECAGRHKYLEHEQCTINTILSAWSTAAAVVAAAAPSPAAAPSSEADASAGAAAAASGSRRTVMQHLEALRAAGAPIFE